MEGTLWRAGRLPALVGQWYNCTPLLPETDVHL